MDNPFDIRLISEEQAAAPILLSICYGASWVVAELENVQTVERASAFLCEHRTKKEAGWMELGRFATCPVTLYVSSAVIGVIVDTNLTVDSFGQSAGIHVPRALLDEFAQALAKQHEVFVATIQSERGLSLRTSSHCECPS